MGFPVFGAVEGIVPAGAQVGGLIAGHLGFEDFVDFPMGLEFGEIFPEADGQASEVGGSEGGGFDDGGSDDGDAEEIGLELHHWLAAGGAAIDAEFLEVLAGIGAHGVDEIGDLEGDAIEGGASDVSGAGGAGDTDDRATGVGIPVGGTEACEGGDEDDAVAIGDGGGEEIDFLGGANELEAIAEPLDGGAADEDTAFEGELAFFADLPGDRGDEALGGGEGFGADILEEETACAVGIFGEAGFGASLAEERGLLVTGGAGDGDAFETEGGGDFAVDFAGGADGGEEGAGDAKEAEEVGIPVPGFEVIQHGAGGITGVGDMDILATGEFPDQPSFYGTEEEISGFGLGAGAGDMIEDPGDFGGGEVGIEDEAGAFLDEGSVASGAEGIADWGGATVLPDDGIVDGFTGVTIPEDGGFALVGDADGGEVMGADFGDAEGFDGDGDLGDPNFLGEMFYPA